MGLGLEVHSIPSAYKLFSLRSIKEKDEAIGTHKHLYVVENPSLFTVEKSHVDICVFMCHCVCVCVNSGLPMSIGILKATDLSLQLLPLILQQHLQPVYLHL